MWDDPAVIIGVVGGAVIFVIFIVAVVAAMRGGSEERFVRFLSSERTSEKNKEGGQE